MLMAVVVIGEVVLGMSTMEVSSSRNPRVLLKSSALRPSGRSWDRIFGLKLTRLVASCRTLVPPSSLRVFLPGGSRGPGPLLP